MSPSGHVFSLLLTSNVCCNWTTEQNDCNDRKHECDTGADCIPTEDSYKCICRRGYTGDGFACYGNWFSIAGFHTERTWVKFNHFNS